MLSTIKTFMLFSILFHRAAQRAQHCRPLVDGLRVLIFGHRVHDYAGPGLDICAAVLQEDGAYGDGQVRVIVKTKIAHAACVQSSFFALELLDDLHGPGLRGARHGARGESGHQHVHRVLAVLELADHVGDDVLDVGVLFNRQVVVHPHGAELRDLTHIVPAEVDQHDMLGQLLGVGLHLFFQGHILGLILAPAPGPGDGPDRDLPVLDLYQDLGAGAHDARIPELEEIHVWRWVDRLKGAVEHDRVYAGVDLGPLGQHDLEGVAVHDVLLGP